MSSQSKNDVCTYDPDTERFWERDRQMMLAREMIPEPPKLDKPKEDRTHMFMCHAGHMEMSELPLRAKDRQKCEVCDAEFPWSYTVTQPNIDSSSSVAL